MLKSLTLTKILYFLILHGEVKNIIIARDHLISNGARVLGDGIPKLGAHDKPVLFLHPKDFSGTLIELEEL